jgi:hypothetical protein
MGSAATLRAVVPRVKRDQGRARLSILPSGNTAKIAFFRPDDRNDRV